MQGRKVMGNFFLCQHGSLPAVFGMVPDQLRRGVFLRFPIRLNEPLSRFLRFFGPGGKNGCNLLIHACAPLLVASATMRCNASWYFVANGKRWLNCFTS